MASQPTWYFGFDFSKIGTPSIVITRGAFTYAALTFSGQTKFYHPFSDGGSPLYASWAAALQTAINAAATAAGDGATTWVVTWNHATLAWTITPSAGTFTATLDALAQLLLGASGSITSAVASFTSVNRPAGVIRPYNDSWLQVERDHEPQGRIVEEETDDATDTASVGPTKIPVYVDLAQLYEPFAAVYDDAVPLGATVPWTWQSAFRHARNVEPIVLVRAPWTQVSVGYNTTDVEAKLRLRADSCHFKPSPMVAKVNLYFRIPLGCRVMQRPSSVLLDLAGTGFTFSRGSEGSYLTAAPNDAVPAFMAWAPNNVLRLEDRGDGGGAMALLEGSRTNILLQCRDIANGAAWTGGAGTFSYDMASPDGLGLADREKLLGAGSQFGPYQSFSRTAGEKFAVSTWGIAPQRDAGPYSTVFIWAQSGLVAGACLICNFSQVYQRYVLIHTLTGTATYFYQTYAGNTVGVGGRAAADCDSVMDLRQIELGAYASSAIRTLAAAATRSADSLSAAATPSWMLTAPIVVPQVSPTFANTDLVSGDVRWLFTLGGANDGVRIRHNGASVKIEAVVGGTIKASSNALTFARHGLLGSVVIDPINAVITVGGSAGPTGTAWNWNAAPAGLRIGGIFGGSGNELDGRVARSWSTQ